MRVWWGLIGLAAAISIAGIIAAGNAGAHLLSVLAVSGFASLFLIAMLRLNALALRASNGKEGRADLACLNAGLLASVFGWGGGAILAGYYLNDIFWHHAWQYGLGMCLAGVLSFGLRWHLARPGRFLRQPQWLRYMTWTSGLLGVGAAAGLAFLVTSGKLTSNNVDWLANHVFVGGGLLVIVVSALATWVQIRPDGKTGS